MCVICRGTKLSAKFEAIRIQWGQAVEISLLKKWPLWPQERIKNDRVRPTAGIVVTFYQCYKCAENIGFFLVIYGIGFLSK